MRPMIRMFVLAAVFGSATAAFAIESAVVNVPFNFKTHGETFPAGIYEVECDLFHDTLKLSSKPTRRCPISGSLLLQRLALIHQRSR